MRLDRRLARGFRLAVMPALALVAVLAVATCREPDVPLASLVDVDPDIVRAVHEAHAAVQADPDSAKAWGDLADRYAAHHFLPEAVRCYARAEELDPESAVWAYRLGWITYMNGSPEDAVAPLERALEKLDGYGLAHEAYGQVLLRLGRLDEAAGQFELASRLVPTSPQAEVGLGEIAFQRGDLEAARAHLASAIERDADHAEAYVLQARVLHALGRVEEARAHAERSRSLPQYSDRKDWLVNPSVPPAGATLRTEFGLRLEQEGKLDEAAEHYRIAIESNPKSAKGAVARQRLARILVKQGRKDEAIELLRDADREGASTALTRDYLAKLLGETE